MNETIIDPVTQEVIHDFRPPMLRWGWNGLNFNVHQDRKTATMLGVGKEIKTGHYLIMRQDEIDFAYLVTSINYHNNPTDMFTAELKIVGTFED